MAITPYVTACRGVQQLSYSRTESHHLGALLSAAAVYNRHPGLRRSKSQASRSIFRHANLCDTGLIFADNSQHMFGPRPVQAFTTPFNTGKPLHFVVCNVIIFPPSFLTVITAKYEWCPPESSELDTWCEGRVQQPCWVYRNEEVSPMPDSQACSPQYPLV